MFSELCEEHNVCDAVLHMKFVTENTSGTVSPDPKKFKADDAIDIKKMIQSARSEMRGQEESICATVVPQLSGMNITNGERCTTIESRLNAHDTIESRLNT